MSSSFIRTKARTNPFFDPIVSVCEKQGLDWWVMVPCEPKDIGYSKSHLIDARLFETLGIWFWRVAHLLFPKSKIKNIYETFGKVLKVVAGGKYNADVIISVGGQYSEQLQGINPKAKFIDLQHGVIYSKHQGYFGPDGLFKDRVRNFKRELWVYGPGYFDCFFKNSENKKWLDGRVKVIGDVLNAGSPNKYVVPNFERRRSLVCMLQFNNSYPMNELLKMKELWESYLEECRETIENYHLDVLIRHHPRFGNVVDFSDWAERFPWARVDARTWNEVYDEALCCVGFNSTTIIEAAGRGIPVIILDGSAIGKDSYFAETFIQDEFQYPVQNMTLKDWLVGDEKGKRSVSKKLQAWHRHLYASFDQDVCLKLLEGAAAD